MSLVITDKLPPLIVAALRLIENAQRANDTAHGVDHVVNVINNCRVILREIKCNEDIVLLAACLHDAIPRMGLSIPGDASNYSAMSSLDILASLHVSNAVAGRISECIRTASWEYHVQGGVPKDLESYVLRDADLLESIGARGIARVFAFAGSHNLALNWTDINIDLPKKLRPNIEKVDESPFRHFETKLLWVRELMFSNTAKAEANRRHAILVQFLQHYSTELSWAFSSGRGSNA